MRFQSFNPSCTVPVLSLRSETMVKDQQWPLTVDLVEDLESIELQQWHKKDFKEPVYCLYCDFP
jgi:hypothetical protein